MAQSATTIYLNEEQRKRLFKLAKGHKSSFSSEIRTAIDRYVEQTESAVSEEEARLLVRQASESIDRMSKALDDAHDAISRILKREQKNRRK